MLAWSINTYQVAGTTGNALKNWTHTHEVELLSYNDFIFGFFQCFPFYRGLWTKSLQSHPATPKLSFLISQKTSPLFLMSYKYPPKPCHSGLSHTSLVLTFHLQQPSLCPYPMTCFYMTKPLQSIKYNFFYKRTRNVINSSLYRLAPMTWHRRSNRSEQSL
jgi:hypothetical protein